MVPPTRPNAAVEEGGGALQHLDALEAFGEGSARIGDVEQPSKAVSRLVTEKPDEEGIALAIGRRVVAHRGIVLHHVADRARLLIRDQLFRVARHVEGRVQHGAVAEEAEPASRRHLAAGLGNRRLAHRSARRGQPRERRPVQALGLDAQLGQGHRPGRLRAELGRSSIDEGDGGRANRPVGQAGAFEDPGQAVEGRERAVDAVGALSRRELGGIDQLDLRLFGEGDQGRFQRPFRKSTGTRCPPVAGPRLRERGR